MTAPVPPQPGSLPQGEYAPIAPPVQPPTAQPQYAQPQYAQGPGVYTAVFKAHTGLLIMSLTSPKQVTGSLADVRRAFWAAQAHCLCLGWFGILSALIYNWIAIFGNISELSRVKAIAKQYGES
ncbi:hypothetical protein [Gordonia crocea]|uniref:Uncharacterized protein n=1 Tax=Gordonia crocea TaxID=589162 RepID=A0A7I9V002_9ACTN|nr:hypothetical protein [Gordonia crocea]GED98516.1 hypothetical protein nbrc107697_25550 [Gordonia crocea]